MTAEFLTGEDLSKRLRHVLQGDDLCCAVAFPGSGFAKLIATGHRARIVCDIIQGSTSAKALLELGAPDNPNLRRRDHLHAKVYLSAVGVVIGSANPSDNGIGFRSAGRPRLLEAGVFHPSGSDVYAAASAWFEALFDDCAPIRNADVKLAREIYRPQRRPAEDQLSPSLLDRVIAAPHLFNGVGFVLVTTAATEEQVKTAKSQASKAHPKDRRRIQDWPRDGLFTEWSTREIRSWPRHFIELWVGGLGGLMLAPRLVGIAHGGTIFSRRDQRALRDLVGDALPSLSEARHLDAPRAAALAAKHKNKLFRTAEELRAALLDL